MDPPASPPASGEPFEPPPALPPLDAETVLRPEPPRRRPFKPARLVLAILGGIAGWVLVSDLSGSTPTPVSTGSPHPVSYDLHGVSFQVSSSFRHLAPNELQPTADASVPASWAKLWDAPWREGFALDGADFIVVYPDEVPFVVDRSNVQQWASALSSNVSSVNPGLPAPTFRTIDRLPAMQLRFTIGTEGTSRSMTEVFDGSSGYIVQCQSSPEHAQDVASACDALNASFAIQDANATARADWQTLSSDSGTVSMSVPPRWAAEHPSDHTTIIQAKLALQGSGALSRVWVGSGPLARAVSSAELATANIKQMPGSWRVIQRRSLSLPAGRAERVELQRGRNVFVMYFLAKGGTGYVLGWWFSGPADLRLFGSTPDVVARSLVIRR